MVPLVTMILAGLCIVMSSLLMSSGGDLTEGFINIPLNETNLYLEKPYDVALEDRYSFVNGTHRFWVYADDKPLAPGSNTQPRTEISFLGQNYSSGVWQFEGNAFVPNGTSGATILQIHGAAHGNTTILLRIFEGDMRYYSNPVMATDLYDKWFRVNLIHDVDHGNITVYIDGEQKFQIHDYGHGPGDLHFKCGVYGAPRNISYYMESRWRDIKILRK